MRRRRCFFSLKYRGRGRWLLFVGVLLLVVIGIEIRTRPIIHTMALYQGKTVAVQMIHEAVEEEMERFFKAESTGRKITDSDTSLLLISRNQKNEVTSLQIDMIQANRLKSRVTAEVLKKLATVEEKEIKISLGTFLGSQIFLGRGPKLTLKLQPSGYVEAQFDSRLESAGINQTLYQLMLRVNSRMITSIPGYTAAADVSTSFIIAQTLISGAVPDAYIPPAKRMP